MLHYFFHVCLDDEQILTDSDGLYFDGPEAAINEGRAAAREMMANCLTQNVLSPAQSILVCDAQGERLKSISLDISALLDRINQ